MRDILSNCEELKGIELPDSLDDEVIRAHLGVKYIDL
jgi:hypothetical protein